jgi:hypothetical protein
VQGHKKHCKQLFVIKVVAEEDVDEQDTDSVEPTISLHALIGIHPRSGHTMQVYILINGTKLRALLDFGSTHNFIDSKAAAWAGIVFDAQHSLCMAVANGDRVVSSGCCHNLKVTIAGKEFSIDCYGRALGSYKMVLVQWLTSLRSIMWDFGR